MAHPTDAPEWAVAHAPADATQATISKAAVALTTHYVTSITVSLEGGANTGGVTFQLRDSTTGAGNVLWTARLNNIANESETITLGGLNIKGVKGQAVTLETLSSTAPAASSSATVAMTGYSLSEAV